MRALRWRIRGSVGNRRDLVACQKKSSGAVAATRVRLVVAFEFAETLLHAAPCFPDPFSHEKELIESGDLKILKF